MRDNHIQLLPELPEVHVTDLEHLGADTVYVCDCYLVGAEEGVEMPPWGRAAARGPPRRLIDAALGGSQANVVGSDPEQLARLAGAMRQRGIAGPAATPCV
jgi:hypothetical protein